MWHAQMRCNGVIYMVNAKLLLIPLMVLLLAMPVVSAVKINDEMLMGAYDDVKCLTDFENSVITSVTAKVPQASGLSAYTTTLNSDTTQLNAYANAGDEDSFKTYLRGTYESDIKNTNAAIRDARKNFSQWNVSAQTKIALRDDYKNAKDTFTACHLGATKRMANGRVNAFNNVLEKWSEKADNLSAKGIDVTDMRSVISGANSTIVVPLDNSLDNAQTGKDVRDTLRSYCLANGCKNGINYHFYAKIEHAKLQAILDFIKPNATSANLTTQVNFAQSELDSVQASLTSVGTAQYSDGQNKIIWDNLKDAAKTIKEIIKSLRLSATVEAG
jgi:hypothetical protein